VVAAKLECCPESSKRTSAVEQGTEACERLGWALSG
jgi:hypothetical protein